METAKLILMWIGVWTVIASIVTAVIVLVHLARQPKRESKFKE